MYYCWKSHSAKACSPEVRGTGNVPSTLKLLLIALLLVDLKTLISSTARGYLRLSPHPTPPSHAKHKASHPRPPLTLGSNLTATPHQQQRSGSAPLGPPWGGGFAHGSHTGQCCTLLGRETREHRWNSGKRSSSKGEKQQGSTKAMGKQVYSCIKLKKSRLCSRLLFFRFASNY